MLNQDVVWQFHRVDDLAPEAMRQQADSLGLAHLPEFISNIHSLQDMLVSGNLRRYLKDLIEHRAFEIVSPTTGRRIASGQSMTFNDKTIFFSFPDEPTMVVIAGDLARGMPICGAFLADHGLVLKLCASDWGLSQKKIDAIAAIMRRDDWKPSPPTEPLTVILGDFNFAHYAWNQLSTLDDLVGLQLPPDIRFVATAQPLGPVHALFPELTTVPPTFVPDAGLPAMNDQAALLASTGGLRIRRGVIERIMRYARDNVSSAFCTIDDALQGCGGPVLWMSVRTTNRTAVNQHEVLTTLAYSFLKCYPDGAVVIDGFSLADDIEAYPGYNRDPFERLVAKDRHAAEAIKSHVDRLLGTSSAVHVAVGLKVPESILLGRHVTVYFCHHGTVQHKVGWFHAKPGMVHCNLAVLADNPSQWVASQSEVAVPPRYIDAALIDEHDGAPDDVSPYGSLLKHDNYRFADPTSVVRAFFSYANEADILPQIDITTLGDHLATARRAVSNVDGS